jgi:hypothetical protein
MVWVLTPIPTSEFCMLSEAVLYSALGRLPLDYHPIIKFSPVTKAGWGERTDFAWQQAIASYVSDGALFAYGHFYIRGYL